MRKNFVILLLLFPMLFFYSCTSIENKKDLAGASSDIKKGKQSRIAEVEKVAMGKVPGLEKKAVEVISETPGKEARNSLLRVAEKADVLKKAKHLAVKKLGDRKEKKTGKLLLEKVKQNKIKDPAALVSLGRLKEQAAIPVMEKALAHPKKTPQALKGLALLGTEESFAIIRELTKSGTAEQKLLAVKALARVKTKSSRNTLQDIIKDTTQDELLRLAAISSLATAGTKESIPVIKNVYSNSKGKIDLKIAMISAMAKIENLSEEEVLDEVRLDIWKKEYKKKPGKGVSAKTGDGLTLKSRLNKISGNSKTSYKISYAFKRLSKMNSPSAQFVYLAYLKMYPDKSFSQIQKAMKKGLKNSKVFHAILKKINKEYSNKAYRILAIRNIFSLSSKESTRIYKAFKKGKL